MFHCLRRFLVIILYLFCDSKITIITILSNLSPKTKIDSNKNLQRVLIWNRYKTRSSHTVVWRIKREIIKIMSYAVLCTAVVYSDDSYQLVFLFTVDSVSRHKIHTATGVSPHSRALPPATETSRLALDLLIQV